MTPARANAMLEETVRRGRMGGILGDAFDKQSAFLKDECRFRAACCTRRAGKSFGIGLLLFARALSRPNVTCLYISLTRESAKRIMWRDVLHVINDKYDLRARFNETALSVTLENGSNIYLLGGDANAAEAAKFKGLKPILAVVDECQDFRTDLEKLCTSVIRPALIDNRGDLLLAGVPGLIKNYFWRVTTKQENTAEWSVHEWSGFDNPHMADVWGAEIASLKEKNPRVVETPWFQQEYLGQWAIDTTNLVYSGYRPEVNDFTEQPNIDSWQFLLGVDFGWTDATALTLGAWSEYENRLYILKAKKRSGLTFSDVAEWIETYRAKYPIHAIVVDGSSKQGVEEIRQRHGIPLEAADKRGKADAIAMMSSDLTLGRVMVLQPHCKALTDEWGGLVWDPRAREKGQLVEHPACENHCFVAGTLVETETGPKPIESIPEGERVWTRSGLRRVTTAAPTGMRPTWELTTTDGRVLRGTEEHPVFANGEWVPLARVTGGSILIGWESTARTRLSSTTASVTADTPSLRAPSSARTSPIASVDGSTVSCGRSATAPSRPGSTSTTSTGTLATTLSRTSNCSTRASICAGTCSRQSGLSALEPASTSLGILPPHGTGRRRGERGTQKTASALLRTVRAIASFARYAAEHLSQSWRRPKSAAPTATQPSAATWAVMTLNGSALDAPSPSGAIDTAERHAAPCRVRSVVATGCAEPVFNLSVEGEPEFFANGVLVHNCSDSALYMWRRATSYAPLDAPKVRGVLPQTTEQMDVFLDARDEAMAQKERSPWWEE